MREVNAIFGAVLLSGASIGTGKPQPDSKPLAKGYSQLTGVVSSFWEVEMHGALRPISPNATSQGYCTCPN